MIRGLSSLPAALLVALCLLAATARAHELRPGYLKVTQTGENTYDVVFKVPAKGNRRLGIYARFPEGVKTTREPVGRFVGGSYVERFSVKCPTELSGQKIYIAGLRKMMTDVLVRIVRLDGSVQVGRIDPTRPSLIVTAAQGNVEKIVTYTAIGVEHILLGVDHLLFVLGLLLIVTRRMMLVKTITAFTLAHSLTLGAATLGIASVPMAPLNATIALSILFLGPEIVRKWRGGTSVTLRRPWLIAFGFGLLHGFGFATGLQTLGLPQDEVVLGLLWFNVGVELGQLGFVLLALLLVRSFRVLEMDWPVFARRLPGFVVGGCGAWWTIDTVSVMLT